jgi:hypothetical protein
MKLYPENYDVVITVMFSDGNGMAVAVSQVTAVVYDGDDQQLSDLGSIPLDAGLSAVNIIIPAADNVLGEGETAAARILRVELTTATGILRQSFSYIIEAESRLELLNNTFISLESAEVMARDMPSLKAWATDDDDKKAAALINAFARLSRVQLRYAKDHLTQEGGTTSRPWPPGRDLCDQDVVIRPGEWAKKTKEEFLAMPPVFRKAVRSAQLIEANDILTDDPIASRHRAGVISETIGESSVMLRGGRLELGVSLDALRALTGFVYYNIRTARA